MEDLKEVEKALSAMAEQSKALEKAKEVLGIISSAKSRIEALTNEEASLQRRTVLLAEDLSKKESEYADSVGKLKRQIKAAKEKADAEIAEYARAEQQAIDLRKKAEDDTRMVLSEINGRLAAGKKETEAMERYIAGVRDQLRKLQESISEWL